MIRKYLLCCSELGEPRRCVLYVGKNGYIGIFSDLSKSVHFCHNLVFIALSFLCVVLSNKTKEFKQLPTNVKFAFYVISQ